MDPFGTIRGSAFGGPRLIDSRHSQLREPASSRGSRSRIFSRLAPSSVLGRPAYVVTFAFEERQQPRSYRNEMRDNFSLVEDPGVVCGDPDLL